MIDYMIELAKRFKDLQIFACINRNGIQRSQLLRECVRHHTDHKQTLPSRCTKWITSRLIQSFVLYDFYMFLPDVTCH